MSTPRGLVLCLSGLDPTGGAGIQADIEAIAAAGGHALPIITALTIQDTRNVSASLPVDPVLLERQIDTVVADCRIGAVKIGLLGDAEQTLLLARKLATLQVPVVCDPVLRAGGGQNLADQERIDVLRKMLLPLVTVLTPNASEARRLAGANSDAATAARELLALGCRHVLVTGGDEPGPTVINMLHSSEAAPVRYEWPRLPETFHGAGCTLASAIAVRLAQGENVESAVAEAQCWTRTTLERAFAIGHGRRIPGRTASEH
jgi:hydroxymethylpyrimidine/phosphomethylpyrimidine kinase